MGEKKVLIHKPVSSFWISSWCDDGSFEHLLKLDHVNFIHLKCDPVYTLLFVRCQKPKRLNTTGSIFNNVLYFKSLLFGDPPRDSDPLQKWIGSSSDHATPFQPSFMKLAGSFSVIHLTTNQPTDRQTDRQTPGDRRVAHQAKTWKQSYLSDISTITPERSYL